MAVDSAPGAGHVDEQVRAAAYRQPGVLTKPQGTLDIRLCRPVGVVFAADHGVAGHGVSAYPREATVQMIANFLAGAAAINVLSKLHGIDLWIVDAGVDGDCGTHPLLIDAKVRRSTGHFVDAPAMTPDECSAALRRGREAVERTMAADSNILILGEMGIGNTASSLRRGDPRGRARDHEGLSNQRRRSSAPAW